MNTWWTSAPTTKISNFLKVLLKCFSSDLEDDLPRMISMFLCSSTADSTSRPCSLPCCVFNLHQQRVFPLKDPLVKVNVYSIFFTYTVTVCIQTYTQFVTALTGILSLKRPTAHLSSPSPITVRGWCFASWYTFSKWAFDEQRMMSASAAAVTVIWTHSCLLKLRWNCFLFELAWWVFSEKAAVSNIE